MEIRPNETLEQLIVRATASAVPSEGPYAIYWLHEAGEDDKLAEGLSLELAFERLMDLAGHEPQFVRSGKFFGLLLGGDEAYRVTSKNPNDAAARYEIMLAAVKHAWGEYKVVTE